MTKRQHLYWKPCVAHCIDLMLEDIGKMSRFCGTLKRAMTLNGYIYNCTSVVNMMRKFMGKRGLVNLQLLGLLLLTLLFGSYNVKKQN